MTIGFVKLGELEIDLSELARFLVRAKVGCYAGDGEEVRLPDGAKRLDFTEGNFFYRDEYAGYFQAPGTEIVRWKRAEGQRIWTMSYSGGMYPEFRGNLKKARRVYEFLKAALGLVSPLKPFRGPEEERWVESRGRNRLIYEARTEGDITSFNGREMISEKNREGREVILFSQDYIGGLVIPK